MDKTAQTRLIKRLADELGFAYCGISRAGFLETEAFQLDLWLRRNMYGDMAYMADNFDMRVDPRLLMPEAKSVLSLMYNYYPQPTPAPKSKFIISKYAHGRDYHRVISKKLNRLIDRIQKELGEVSARACVDSAPVMEKAWAVRSGLGWIGKHTNLLTSRAGSFFFLSEILLDIELEYDRPTADHCGKCRRCIDACPTGAIVEPYVLDAAKCISYLTIELKEAIPKKLTGKYKGWVFGCDICQDVCPFNRFSKPHREPEFTPLAELFAMTDYEWRTLTEERYQKLFRGSAVKRAKYEGLMRNIRFVDS
jgi:epoxyqueuosine reductase